ncbi:TPA: hypothetical protein UM524_002348 [Stenotrophomonas maltophilia]|nr:hypothetical protein [Stenotrophomonas maltophilia]
MSAIFLSASVPLIERAAYHETANPFLIQCAVRELFISVIREHKIIWGGHPAITPMVWSICEDLGINYSDSVTLYQSRFFEEWFPEENLHFRNVIYTDSICNDKEKSLLLMRRTMLSRDDFVAAVFIGGMEGVEEEHNLFKELHPTAKILPVASPGGAALCLAKKGNYFTGRDLEDIDFAKLFHSHLNFKRPQAI